MASFLQTLSRETGKLKFKDFAIFGALAAILTQGFRIRRKNKNRIKLTGVSIPVKSFRKTRKRKVSKRV